MSLNSIVKTAMERYCELLKVFFGSVQEWNSLDDGVERLEALLDTLGVHLLELTVQQLSEIFFASEERRESGLRVKERGRTRQLYTPFGTAELTNDIYENPHANAAEGERRCFSPPMSPLPKLPKKRVTLRTAISAVGRLWLLYNLGWRIDGCFYCFELLLV